MTGQERRAARRAARQQRRGGRQEKRQARRAARREKRGDRGWGQEVRSKIEEWRGVDAGAPGKAANGPQVSTPGRIPGPGPQGTGWAGAPGAPGTVATTTAAGWWMDPKILILGAAALFILMRKK